MKALISDVVGDSERCFASVIFGADLTSGLSGSTNLVVLKEFASLRACFALVILVGQLLAVIAPVHAAAFCEPSVRPALSAQLDACDTFEVASPLPAAPETGEPVDTDTSADASDDDDDLVCAAFELKLPRVFAGADVLAACFEHVPYSRERGKAPERPPQA